MTGPDRDIFPIPSPGRFRHEFLLRKPPFWLASLVVIVFLGAFIPLALIARSRATTSEKPRVHLMMDMANQPRYSTQQPSTVFADGRAMRAPVPGTVARGMLADNDHYDRGFELVKAGEGEWQISYFNGLPANVKLDSRMLTRGQTVFNIYCSACHGRDGYGHGAVNERALEKQEPKWVPAANLHTDEIRSRVDGHIYNTIRNGIRTMPGYGSQIDVKDRWAVVAYVRALQRSQNATLDDVPSDQRDKIK
ncbi:MAG: cytochrome c [Planctomycetota bacterium]|nr:cytochrome c [Planctomycetota bacterium]